MFQTVGAAFLRNRRELARRYPSVPPDMNAARQRLAPLLRHRELKPTDVLTLHREGTGSRTAFQLALAQLTDMLFDLIARVVQDHDIDTLALVCRAHDFPRPIFVTLAISL